MKMSWKIHSLNSSHDDIIYVIDTFFGTKGYKHCSIKWEKQTILRWKYKPHLVTVRESVFISLITFQNESQIILSVCLSLCVCVCVCVSARTFLSMKYFFLIWTKKKGCLLSVLYINHLYLNWFAVEIKTDSFRCFHLHLRRLRYLKSSFFVSYLSISHVIRFAFLTAAFLVIANLGVKDFRNTKD